MAEDFVIEMLHITKEFPGIKANDDITLQLRKGEVLDCLLKNMEMFVHAYIKTDVFSLNLLIQ